MEYEKYYELLQRLNKLERLVETLMTEIKILKQGGNL